MAKHAQSPLDAPLAQVSADSELSGLLDEIEQEETPGRLIELAIELQRRLVLRRQRQGLN